MVCTDFNKLVNAIQEKINAMEAQGLYNNAKDYSRVLKFIKQQPTVDAEVVVRCQSTKETMLI